MTFTLVQLFHMKAAAVPVPPHTHTLLRSYRGHTECGPEPQINRLIGSTFRLQGRIMAIIDFSVSYIVWKPNLGLPLTNYTTWDKLLNLPRSQDSIIIIVTIIWKIIFVLHSGSTEEKMFLTLTGAVAPVMPLRDRKAPWAKSREKEEKTQYEPGP